MIWRLVRWLIRRLAGPEIRRLLVIGSLVIDSRSALLRGLSRRQSGSALLAKFSGLLHSRSTLCAEFVHRGSFGNVFDICLLIILPRYPSFITFARGVT